MPNWCANRLRVTGLAENVSHVRALMEGNVRPLYMRAEAEGIQLFLAGCAGLLRPVTDETYAPLPALTAAGPGEDTPENRAFTQWLAQLRDGAELTDKTCYRLHDLWLATGIRSRKWDVLDDEAQAVMNSLWKRKFFDWSGVRGSRVSEFWIRTSDSDAIADGSAEFDMHLLLPTRLDVEINGFNGGLLDGIPGGYEFYIAQYGVKWPGGYALEVGDCGPDFLEVDFDTPWSPPDGRVFEALSKRFSVTVEHWYAESGCSFCGFALYSDGELTDSLSSQLEWDEEDEDGITCVIGPDWIVNNIGHFGG
ncbi:DUF1281 domain-containing protein [Pantoea agglomerans]|uniref:DUF1281 domain-containing protein n=1 Tax=Pantoea TaxID=53335 RepID=UPI0021A506C0|nr:DUF1281 domain-containing protein [Pantoea sp. XY16]MCT2420331.1 DUF1281 domain-containing protein [Pantoea sp. XY16]